MSVLESPPTGLDVGPDSQVSVVSRRRCQERRVLQFEGDVLGPEDSASSRPADWLRVDIGAGVWSPWLRVGVVAGIRNGGTWRGSG